jgi:hypothetical protein
VKLEISAAIASCLLLSGSAAMATTTQYYFSGNACQGQIPSDRDKVYVVGAGVTNFDTTAFSSAVVTCPVMGLESTSFHLAGTFTVHVHNAISAYFEIDNQSLGVIWYSSSQSTTTSGDHNITWSGTGTNGLYTSLVSSYSSYSLIATIGGPCVGEDICPGENWVQSYWIGQDAP